MSVADFLQTDDLYQLAQPRELPELPDFSKLSLLTCGHAGVAEACLNRAGVDGHGAAPSGAVMPLSQPPEGTPVGPASSARLDPLKPCRPDPPAACHLRHRVLTRSLAGGGWRAGSAREQRTVRFDAQGERRRDATTSSSIRGIAGRPPACRSSGPTDVHKPVRSGP